ncbi:hypothetical protein, partial [Pseudomonas sp.]|uniref:hypothetical protein n=1 Tax=Pseudomonas sp. TaxID=306 RepID=UPI003BAE67ED
AEHSSSGDQDPLRWLQRNNFKIDSGFFSVVRLPGQLQLPSISICMQLAFIPYPQDFSTT